MNIVGNRGPKNFITQKGNFIFYFHRRNFFNFRKKNSDLEIAETFENTITDVLIRFPNLPPKKYMYAFLFEICPDIPKSQ